MAGDTLILIGGMACNSGLHTWHSVLVLVTTSGEGQQAFSAVEEQPQHHNPYVKSTVFRITHIKYHRLEVSIIMSVQIDDQKGEAVYPYATTSVYKGIASDPINCADTTRTRQNSGIIMILKDCSSTTVNVAIGATRISIANV